MFGWRYLMSAASRTRPVLANKLKNPMQIQKLGAHAEGPPQPFDNMPFSIPNRYVTTLFFSVFFGVGFYAPFLILWYMMAKKTL